MHRCRRPSNRPPRRRSRSRKCGATAPASSPPTARASSRPLSLAALKADEVRMTLCRPLDLPDREPAARAHRDRLQRLRAAAGPARHRHHEPRARHPLHRHARSGIKHVLRGWGPSPAEPARTISSTRTCACATCRPTSATGAAAPSATATRSSSSRSPTCASRHLGHLHHTLDAAAAQRDRPRRRRAGAGRRRLHARPRRHDRGAAPR